MNEKKNDNRSEYVREIYPLKEFTPIPCTPPFVLGIINVRGQILSVIDIKKFFDLPEKGLPISTRLLSSAPKAWNLASWQMPL